MLAGDARTDRAGNRPQSRTSQGARCGLWGIMGNGRLVAARRGRRLACGDSCWLGEHYVASAMLLIGAAARLLGLAFACSLMCASQHATGVTARHTGS